MRDNVRNERCTIGTLDPTTDDVNRPGPHAVSAGRATLTDVAYDEDLADRLRVTLQGERDVSEKRMFGGLAFLIGGHMAVSASGQGGLLLRVDPALTESLIQRPHVARFVMRGREMDGWLRVDAAAVSTDADLAHWSAYGVAYARTLPPK